MGFLEAGTPLSWPASLEHIPYVRKHGILQFLHTFHRVKHRQNDVLKWGDEIEYHLVRFFDEERRTAISLTAPELVHALEAQDKAMKFPIASAWRPEYGSWMVEATPGAPYGGDTSDLRRVEVNMAMRRYRIAALCPRGVVPVSIVNYPLLGAPGAFTDPPLPPGGPFSRSAYVPDACISPHPRFGTLTANIRKRRGRKVPIQMPLFMDAKTQPGAAIAAVDAAADGGGAEGPTAFAAALAGGPGGGLGAERAAALAAAADDASSRLPEAAIFAGGAEAHARATGDWDADTSVGPAHAPEPQHIHMDAMVFGMGCCCLQVTFQARDLAESRYLYDQLHVLSPLMMALTANAPIWRGHLADTDTRWDVIAASVDCRTPQERGCCCPSAAAAAAAAAPDSAASSAGCGDAAGPAASAATTTASAGDGSAGAGAQATPAAGSAHHYDSCLPSWMALPAAAGSAGGGVRPISKSRYSSIDCFISASPLAKEGYNDVPLAYDEEASAILREAGVDERLSRHIAHLFVRDPLVIFKERITLDDALSSEHFENIQSTNWRSVRWKPPPPDAPDMGWRVELRTMEAQVTDFENAAFTVFVVLLSRVILSFDLNLYIPLSKVDANFERAREREAASKQTFFFRKHVMRPGGGGPAAAPAEPSAAAAAAAAGLDPEEDAYAEMSAAEILLGKGPFPGLIPLVFAYLDVIECDAETRIAVDHYLRFVAGRATGEIMTGASWQRAFVAGHPEYKQDSVVPPSVVFDMLQRLDAIAAAREAAPSLLGPLAPLPITVTESALSPPPPSHGPRVAAAAAAGAPHTGADTARGPLSPPRSAAGHSSPATPASPAEQALAQQRLMAAMRTYEALAAGAAEGGAAHATAAAGREPTAATAGSAAPATAAAAAAAGGAGLGVKMRGRSFAEEIAAPTHPVIRRLLERFTLRDDGRSFADVPAFLGSP